MQHTHPYSNAQTVICRTAHLLPNTQRDALQRREGSIYLEVIKMLSLKIVPSKLVISPAHLIPLWAPLLQGLSALGVLQTASKLSCFVSKPWLMWSLPGAHVPQGPAWWPQINARDICHHSEPVLPVPSSSVGLTFHLLWLAMSSSSSHVCPPPFQCTGGGSCGLLAFSVKDAESSSRFMEKIGPQCRALS